MGAGRPRDVIFTMTLEGDAANLRDWERPLMERALHEASVAAQEAFFRSLLCESRNEENHRRPPLAGPAAPPPFIPHREPSPPQLRSVKDRTPTPLPRHGPQPLPPLDPSSTSSAPGGTRVPVVVGKRLPSIEHKSSSSSSEDEDSSFHPSDDEEAMEAWRRAHPLKKKRIRRSSPSSSDEE